MKNVLLIFSTVLLLSNKGFAKNTEITYFCDLKHNGSEVFLKIIEISDEPWNKVSVGAELIVDGGPPVLISEIKKTSKEVPGFSFRSITSWSAPQFELVGYFDHSFPSRTVPVDFYFPDKDTIRGVCEF